MPTSRPGRRLGRRPGPRPSLTREAVARAALAEGLDRMSMPSVARRLGVSHATLYTYVTDRNDLVLAATGLAITEHSWPDATLDWRPLLESFTDALWDFLSRNPGMATAVMTMAGVPEPMLDLVRRYSARLRDCGFTPRESLVAFDFVADLVVATAVAMAGLDEVIDSPQGPRTRRDAYRSSFADLPALSEESTWTGRGWLDDKIAILLDGLELRLTRP